MNKNKIPNFGVFLITDYMEVIMELKEKINKIIAFGIPISVIAKKVNKDHSTIGKWLRGQSQISNKLEQELNMILEDMNKEWQSFFN